jgi:peptide chain release factor subunit 1
MVDISYGGENGFNQAIDLAADCLSNVKFIQEKKLIGMFSRFSILPLPSTAFYHPTGRYFDEVHQDSGKYCFGVEDTLEALKSGAVETLICWENLDMMRYELKVSGSEDQTNRILHLTSEQERDTRNFIDAEVSLASFDAHFSENLTTRLQSGLEMELIDRQPLLEWIANNYKSFGTALEIVTDRSQEGSQFVRGFGGIGGTRHAHCIIDSFFKSCSIPTGILHYKVNFLRLDEAEFDDLDYEF